MKRQSSRDVTLPLPLEILHQIVGHIEDPNLTRRGKINTEYVFTYAAPQYCDQLFRRKTIHNLRLVDKRWCSVASAYLIPILRIRLNEKSLELADKISKISHIAMGVRGVELALEIYPETLVANLDQVERLIGVRLQDKFDDIFDSFESISEEDNYDEDETYIYLDSFCNLGNENGQGGTGSPKEIITIGRAREIYRTASQLYGRYHGPGFFGCNDTKEKRNPTAVMSIRERGAQHFQHMLIQQQRLIQSGTFAERVALIMARLDRMDSVWICDKARDDYDVTPTALPVAQTLIDEDELFKSICSPMEWNWPFEGWRRSQVQLPVKLNVAMLLCDIPVAIARTGKRLRGLHLSCWPIDGGMSFLEPENCALAATHQELVQAMSHVERFSLAPALGTHYMPDGTILLEGTINQEQSRGMLKYLEACISGQRLRELTIDAEAMALYMPKTRNMDSSENRNRFIQILNLEHTFSALQTHRLIHLELNTIAVSHADLSKLVERLDKSGAHLSVDNVHLLDGSWREIIEALRQSKSRSPNLSKRDWFKHVSGGHFRETEWRVTNGSIHPDDALWPTGLIKSIGMYLAGESGQNPFDWSGPMSMAEAKGLRN